MIGIKGRKNKITTASYGLDKNWQ